MKARQPARRARSNDGIASSITSVLPISPGLMASLTAHFSEPRKKREPKIYNGPKAYKPRGLPPSAMTDEQVLAIRKMREWDGLCPKQISQATGLPVSKIYPIIYWQTRVHLDPGPRPEPGASDEGGA
jgi:hypothetical protein